MTPPLRPSPQAGGRSTVIVEPPVFPLQPVRQLLEGLDLAVAAEPRPWQGEDVVGLLAWQPVTAQDMERLPRLRVIVTGSIGFDHIDIEAAKKRGLWVCNTPDYCVDEVADTTIALLLTLVRGIVFNDRFVAGGGWDDHAVTPLPRIADIKLGIIGFGRIGRAVGRRARALGIETQATDPLVPAAAMASAGVTPASLPELLQNATAITLHVPLARGGEPLIGAREIAMMPRGAYLINTARGQLVDTAALLSALEDGQLAGAAIDVLPVEPPTPAAPAPHHPRLIVTPHAAWFSAHAEGEVVRSGAMSLRAVLEGREPHGIVVHG